MREFLSDACKNIGYEAVEFPSLPESNAHQLRASNAHQLRASDANQLRASDANQLRASDANQQIPPLPAGEGRGEGSREVNAHVPPLDAPADFTAAIWDLATTEPAEIAAFATAAENFPHARWIVLAGFVRQQDRALLLRRGASEVLSKPLTVDQLRDALAAQAPPPRRGQRLLFF